MTSTSEEHDGVALTRTSTGWAVVSMAGAEPVGELVVGLCLADLVLEEAGGCLDLDRGARRSARGAGGQPDGDPRDARIATLERTVEQLEHALAARVSIERAIGVLAERHRSTPRAAFDQLRQAARSQGRAVAELAGEVLDDLRSSVSTDGEGELDSFQPPCSSAGACRESLPAVPDGTR